VCGHLALPTSPEVARYALPQVALWRAQEATKGERAAIAGTYTLNRHNTLCVSKIDNGRGGCSESPMTVIIECNADQCTISRTDGVWEHPHVLILDGDIWRASGRDNNATNCHIGDGPEFTTPSTIRLELSVVSRAIVDGVGKAQKLKGTYWAKQDAGTCTPLPQGSEAQYDLFSA
jgi:hypothetical protein